MSASPRPWRYSHTFHTILDSTGHTVATLPHATRHPASEDRVRANSDLILRAVNHHEELLAIIGSLMSLIDANGWQGGAIPRAKELLSQLREVSS